MPLRQNSEWIHVDDKYAEIARREREGYELKNTASAGDMCLLQFTVR